MSALSDVRDRLAAVGDALAAVEANPLAAAALAAEHLSGDFLSVLASQLGQADAAVGAAKDAEAAAQAAQDAAVALAAPTAPDQLQDVPA